ncbi:DNA internalization-related competence protein ComEC/Rec2 [Streptococcus sp. 121]|uniref:DNA internalization-related competence protein ComEC/Rec2 n=1 Tax=Streptococcus sp. 121 TaxID=2797637 RepID=UPI0018F06D98|nr:DNA internalization-related competence protein ComEC/Rec2 [Streptococcus sp. 121]MBJ6745439.1 DNA internalization-related competence protein ComEC/Rec2 [Streptococcus sp. 121]
MKQFVQSVSQKLSLPHVAFLAGLSYFTWATLHPLLIIFWLLSMCFLYWNQGREVFLMLTLMLLILGVTWQLRQKLSQDKAAMELEAPRQVFLKPDSLIYEEESLKGVAQWEGHSYRFTYRLKEGEDLRFLQKGTSLPSLVIEGELGEAREQENFGGFDYRAYLAKQGIYHTLKITKIEQVTWQETWNPIDKLSIWRAACIGWIQSTYPEELASYMTGLLLGYLPASFEDRGQVYRQLGIFHLFALSGMQVDFFTKLYRRVFARLGLTKESLNQLQWGFSFMYAGLTGWSPSVLRALVQQQLALLGLRGMQQFWVLILLLAGLAPHYFRDMGAILSLSFAFVLQVLAQDRCLATGRKQAPILALASLPVLCLFFSEYQPFGILLTFLLSLLFDRVLLPLFLILLFFVPLTKGEEINSLLQGLDWCLQMAQSYLPGPIIFGQPSLPVFLGLCLCLAFMWDFRSHKRRFRLCFSLFLTGLLLTKFPLVNEITLVNIGQGDSIFLRDWQGRHALIDVGGKVSFGSKLKQAIKANAEYSLIPYLKSRGIDHLEQVFLTHPDADHVGDLLAVDQAIPISHIYVSPGSLHKAGFLDKLEATQAQIHLVEPGQTWPIFDSQLQALYPLEEGQGDNNDSLVLYGQFYQTRFLFTGDLEKEGEDVLMNHYPDLTIDVLKLGHHGSKGSSTPAFLDYLHPSLALISAGKDNRYHHPHEETLERLRERGIPWHRTDQEGAIRLYGWWNWKLETVRMLEEE